MPRVSVIMVVHNGEKYLRDSIESVLNQTFADFEFIVIDDGSTDGSLGIIRSYRDPRIRLMQNDTNIGLVAVRNKGLASARGKYIAWLDCDDIAYPVRLLEQFSFMERNPEFGMVGSWFEAIDENGVLTGKVWKYRAPSNKIPSILLFHNYFAQSSVFLRRSILADEQYRLYPGAEDYDLWVRMAKKAKVWNLQRILLKYRVHEKSITHANAQIIEGYVKEIVGRQLMLLGVDASSEDIEIHRKLVRKNFEPSLDFLADAEEWLLKIYKHNSNSKYYGTKVFEECLGEKWFGLCRFSSGLGMRAWGFYHKSRLSKLANFKPLRDAYLAVKCCQAR